MYIHKVLSYKGAWENLQQSNYSELQDINSALTDYFNILISSESKERVIARDVWEQILFKMNWQLIDRAIYTESRQRVSIGNIGPVKNGIAAKIAFGMSDELNRWIFQQTTIAIRHGAIKLPILLVPTADYEKRNSERMFRSNFDICKRQIDLLSPLSHPLNFLILAYSDKALKENMEVFEVQSDSLVQNSNDVIDRCIEFPPEYHQAGLGILNFFGTYLREQYPQEEAKIKIIQEGLLVRMVIETTDGKSEVIEKALHEYQLIVTGEASPEKFTQNDKLILELKNELRVAKFRVESQQDIIRLQSGNIDTLNDRINTLLKIVGDGVANKPVVAIDFKPNVLVTNNIQINQDVSYALGSINELKDLLPPSSEASVALKELEGSLEAVEKEANPEVVRKSPAMSKFKKFIDKVTEGNNEVQKAIKAVEQGWDIFKDLAGKYNKIAEWCGLPQVPSVFTK
jgi:hypothetical protein